MQAIRGTVECQPVGPFRPHPWVSIGILEELSQNLKDITLQHLGRIWLKGLAPVYPRIGVPFSRRSCSARYYKILAKRRAAGLDEQAAHRATLCARRGLSIRPEDLTLEALRKGPKPRSYHKQLSKLLETYEDWLR